ncbi:MAG: hypothetical protein GX585_02330, partial [Clostridiales bacterium]|nr:hypothetical protein [Clostridiales bacterium]
MEHQPAKIHIESQMAALRIGLPKRAMRIERESARAAVELQDGTIRLNMKRFLEHIGLKGVPTLTKENAARAQARAVRGIKETVNTGDRISTLPARGNPIGQAALRKMLEPGVPEGGGRVPAGAIEMEGRPG